MKWFEYGDEKISHREILIAIPSMVIGVGILSLPRAIATSSIGSDGWIPLLISGAIITFFTWLVAKLAASFPNQSFLTYASKIVTKPIAIVITFIFGIIFTFLTAFEVREISSIAKQYLFDRTPVEVIALTFLFVVVYAVSGSRAGIFRLNLMFLPIIITIAVAVSVFNLGWFSYKNLLPVFQTGLTDYGKGITAGLTSYMGFGIILFYTQLVEKPERAPKAATLGMMLSVAIYVLLFITCIGVFGHSVTKNLLFPTIELAKEVDIPGGFFERFESVFFVIWIMAIFNTTVMALDIAVFSLSSIFKNKAKMKLIFILSPIVYLIAMFPKNVFQVLTFGTVLSYVTVSFTLLITILLSIIAKIRKVKQGG